jgi:hypothetical protein
MDGKEARRFEAHLKMCSDCQTEMVDLEEVASAALEIVDQAPDFDYWSNFPARVLNRIISRDVSPYEGKRRPAKSLRLKIGSYSVAITALAAAVLLVLNYTNRSQIIPDTSIRDGIDISSPAVAPDIIEPIIFTLEEPDGAPAFNELENISADRRTVPAAERSVEVAGGNSITVSEDREEISQPSRAELALQADYDFRMIFRKPASFGRATLKLDDDYSHINRLMAAYRGRKANDYRISQAVVAEGILSGYSSREINRLENGNYGLLDIGPFPGSAGISYSSGWGYLSLPEDTSDNEELRKYLIELELMRAK